MIYEDKKDQDEASYDAEQCFRDCSEMRSIYEEKPFPDCGMICGLEREPALEPQTSPDK